MKTLAPNDFSKKVLVEECRKIKISDFLRNCQLKLKKLTLELEINAQGVSIDLTTSNTRFGGERIWFVCPLCHKRVGVLLEHPVTQEMGCRTCLGLDYAKRVG